VASGTFPPVVHALTVHCAACPRRLLAAAGETWTQRLVGVVSETVLAPLCEFLPVAVAVGVLVGVPVAVREGLATAGFGVPVVGFGVRVRVGTEVAAGLDFKVRVGAGLAAAVCVGWEPEGLAVAVGFFFGVEVGDLLGVAVGVFVVGVAVGLVAAGVGVGVGEPEDGEGDELDGAVDGGNGSHDAPLAAVAVLIAVPVLAVAVFAVTARPTPEAAVRSTLPAISVTVAGRACAKRMKRPTPTSAARRVMRPVGHHAPLTALHALLPRLSVMITAQRVIMPVP